MRLEPNFPALAILPAAMTLGLTKDPIHSNFQNGSYSEVQNGIKPTAKKVSKSEVGGGRGSRRHDPKELREEAVQMVLDGHSASSVHERLGLSAVNLLYRWKKEVLERGGKIALNQDAKGRELEVELRQVERERDLSNNVLGILTYSVTVCGNTAESQ